MGAKKKKETIKSEKSNRHIRLDVSNNDKGKKLEITHVSIHLSLKINIGKLGFVRKEHKIYCDVNGEVEHLIHKVMYSVDTSVVSMASVA